MISFLLLFACVSILGSFIPLYRFEIWWLRAWTYPRLAMLIINLFTLILICFVMPVPSIWGWAIIIGLCAAALYCARDLFPYTRLAKTQSIILEDDTVVSSFSVLVGNVLMENTQGQGLLESVAQTDPDIIFLVETDEDWKDRMSPLETRYPFTRLLPLEDFNGLLFYSKFEILEAEIRYLVQDHIPSLSVLLDISGQTVRFFGVHPRPPRPEDDTADMEEELDIFANEAAESSVPVMLCGDLNDVGWSPEIKDFLANSQLLDPRRGRGLYNSFNAKVPIVRWPLDHLFHSKHFGTVSIRRLPKFGSDHFPILFELGFIPIQERD